MGSWNGTCGITQLSIRSGNPIALFLIANIDDHEQGDQGHCYSDTIWCPIGLPVYGKYNDYGWIEDVNEDGPNERHLIALLRKFAIIVPPENEYRAGVTPETLVWDTLEDAIHSSILRIRDDDGVEYTASLAKTAIEDDIEEIKKVSRRYSSRPTSYRVGLMMVHREIYDALATSYPHWLHDKNISIAHTISEAETDIANLKAKMSDVLGKHFADDSHMLIYLAWNSSRSLFSTFFTHFQVYARQYIETYSADLIVMVDGKEPEQPWTLEYMISEICRFETFSCNMSRLRKSWEPQAGAGSQHDNEKDHLRLTDLARPIIDRRIQEDADSEAEFEDNGDEC